MVREHCRANFRGLPFQIFLKLLNTHIVLNKVNMLNFFSSKGGILYSLIPNTIMSGETLYFQNYPHIHLGHYCHVHEEEIIDEVPDEVISTVKFLRYLNYEPIDCTSSTRHLVCTRNVLGYTV